MGMCFSIVLEAKAAAAFRISFEITNETEQKINYISKMFCLLNKSAVSFIRRERRGGACDFLSQCFMLMLRAVTNFQALGEVLLSCENHCAEAKNSSKLNQQTRELPRIRNRSDKKKLKSRSSEVLMNKTKCALSDQLDSKNCYLDKKETH